MNGSDASKQLLTSITKNVQKLSKPLVEKVELLRLKLL